MTRRLPTTRKPPAKPKRKRKRYGNPKAARSWEGALGKTPRGPGLHQVGKGQRTSKLGRSFLIFDKARVLSSPVSLAVAEAMYAADFARWTEQAAAFFASRGRPEDPIIHVGTIAVERGRIFQPWGATEHTGNVNGVGEAIKDIAKRTKKYTSLRDIASTRATAKTGVLGWFLRSRTRYAGAVNVAPTKHKRPPKKKPRRAPARTTQKKRTSRKPLRRVGRRSKTRVRR